MQGSVTRIGYQVCCKDRIAASACAAGELQWPEGSAAWPQNSSCSVWERCWSDAWPQRQQLQRPGSLQERCVAPKAAVASSRGRKTPNDPRQEWRRPGNEAQARNIIVEQHLQRLGSAVAWSGSVAGAFGPGSSNCSVWERCRSVTWPYGPTVGALNAESPKRTFSKISKK